MDHKISMRIRHCLAHLLEEAQALRNGEGSFVGKNVDGFALNVFHGQPRPAILGIAGAQQIDDIGMVEAGKNFLLFVELPGGQRGEGASVQHLDRHSLIEATLDSMSAVDLALASEAELVVDAPGTELLSD